MRQIRVVTVGRSDYGLYRPILDRLDQEPGVGYGLIVSGSHLLPGVRGTVGEIVADGRPIAGRVVVDDTGSGSAAMATAMGSIITGCATLFAQDRPDMLLVLGDRFEMFAAAAAAVPFNIPIAHVHGGELSFGAIDDVFRHAITKMSHLHFAATQEYADRIVRMGEEPWRVQVSGAPGLDTALNAVLPDRAELSRRFGIPLDQAPILVTFHPVTRETGSELHQIGELLAAMEPIERPIVFTAPNADGGSNAIREAITGFVAMKPNRYFVESFGSLNYLAMLREAAAVVGNSSSGLIETPAFRTPTVNVGDRQDGRTRASNVIDVPVDRLAIENAIARALSPEFGQSLAQMVNPYGDGDAARRIVTALMETPIDSRLIAKRFHDAN